MNTRNRVMLSNYWSQDLFDVVIYPSLLLPSSSSLLPLPRPTFLSLDLKPFNQRVITTFDSNRLCSILSLKSDGVIGVNSMTSIGKRQ